MSDQATIDKLLAEIIPPNDYQHRNGFNNHILIDKLFPDQKALLEDTLIKKLAIDGDLLVVETLAYLQSTKSVPILQKRLDQTSDAMSRLVISAAIYKIAREEWLVKIAITAFRQLENKYDLIFAFYYLGQFKHRLADKVIKEYTKNQDFLVSYNAKRALET